MRWKVYRKKRYLFSLGGFGIFFLWYIFSLPDPIFNDPYSTVLEDNQGNLLGVAIANDDQWRFPSEAELPEKYVESVMAFEDQRFKSHFGVDILAMGRAIQQNVATGKVVSGGSTITMQVIRLSQKNHDRNLWVKFKEVLQATRLEISYSKKEIMELYATHAPFGGNVVGLSAACARYFGNSAAQLSWAEAAMLAVLPNEPSLIHPGKNRDKLFAKRNRLLKKLWENDKIDSLTYSLSIDEPLPDAPLPFPTVAPHLLTQAIQDGMARKRIRSTLNRDIQIKANEILMNHASRLVANQVHNGAVLIAEVKTGNVLAYVGNILSSREHQDQVNIITSQRSTGSILKPFLFAAMVEEGKILPGTLIPDVPMDLAGFTPENFNRRFDGAVPANVALIRSLNVPAVLELRDYRYEKFHTLLKRLGMTTLKSSASNYGLTLIIGGAEGTLWDITGMYASMGRVMSNYFERPGSNRYSSADVHPLHYINAKIKTAETLETNSVLGAGSIWATVEALKEVYRPGEESGWRNFSSSKTIAWKTGTSLGHRDAWSIGINPDYVVGVWVGNADGEGRPGLTGTEAAAPILFDVFSMLPSKSWFQKPNSELTEMAVCHHSGMRATDKCDLIDTIQFPKTGLKTTGCTYHKIIPLSQDKKFRVNSLCEETSNIEPTKWFVLPSVQEYYFRLRNPSYKPLPPFRSGCSNPQSFASMEMVYPKQDSKVYIPKELDGSLGKIVLEAAHRQPATAIYWHIDGQYSGTTRQVHQLAITLNEGRHELTLVDESGEVLNKSLTILSKH